MFNENINIIDRIRLELRDLKNKDSLNEVYILYRDYLSKYFVNGKPIQKYFVKVNCPICNSTDTTNQMILDNISYESCLHCGCIYTPMMLREDLLKEMYSSGAYQEYYSKLVLTGQSIRRDVLELRKCRQISSFFAGPGRLLDVGCGSGSLLSVCRDHGWDVYGVDPSDGAVETARVTYGLDVWKGFFEYYDPGLLFDCISFFGIEHLQDPMAALKRAPSILKTDGLVIFEVPSADGLLINYVRSYPFEATRFIEAGRHYLFFSKDTIDYICKVCGFKIEYMETNGLDLDTILLDKSTDSIVEEILNIQEIINSMLMGDHYRVVLRKI